MGHRFSKAKVINTKTDIESVPCQVKNTKLTDISPYAYNHFKENQISLNLNENTTTNNSSTINCTSSRGTTTNLETSTLLSTRRQSQFIPIPFDTINLHIEEDIDDAENDHKEHHNAEVEEAEPEIETVEETQIVKKIHKNNTNCNSSISSICSSISNNSTSGCNSSNCQRKIIIKIQLATMMNDGDKTAADIDSCVSDINNGNSCCDKNNVHEQVEVNEQEQEQEIQVEHNSRNSSPIAVSRRVLNVTTAEIENTGTAGGSTIPNNNNDDMDNNSNDDLEFEIHLLKNRTNEQNALNDSTEYIEVLQNDSGDIDEIEEINKSNLHSTLDDSNISNATVNTTSTNHCCHRQKSKRKCCKCTCSNAWRKIIKPSSKSIKNKEKHSNNSNNINKDDSSSSSKSNRKQNVLPSQPSSSSITSTISNQKRESSLITTSASTSAITNNGNSSNNNNHIEVWTTRPGVNAVGPPTIPSTLSNDVVIPLRPNSQVVVVQCRTYIADAIHLLNDNFTANTNNNSINNSNNSILPAATQEVNRVNPGIVGNNNMNNGIRNFSLTTNGPIVHSQVDFVHYLVPDLEKITNSSFYWGKMDRYEAERLLEGKPEGTFLLRYSAQEEFLFSVTFRKYGRSLHARIEQSGHKFSFDCHDPCVFTAPTVTGLLEHYKDPACVMFFEPMLTIPLHRPKPFSLQQLCRATIVSRTTYDGINKMELPLRLKSYLKEYHYKQKIRVKSDDQFYTCP